MNIFFFFLNDLNYQNLCFRYNQRTVWKFLLTRPDIDVNLENSHGQTALHTAARFNVPEAAADILKREDVMINSRSVLGSSPVIVAVKYASADTLQVLVNDVRVSIDTMDNKLRKVEDLIGVALLECSDETKKEIMKIIDNKKPPCTCDLKETRSEYDEGYLTVSSIISK